MQVRWLIDGTDFDPHHQGLADVIARQGYEVKALGRPTPPYGWEDTNDAWQRAFPRGACVVTLADIDLMMRVRRTGCWTPGVFGTVENYFCSHYYAHLGRFLLNGDYLMLPFAEIERQADFLFGALGRDNRVFIRPDSPLKTFTGLIVTRETLQRDLEFMAFYDFPMEDLVVVSSPKAIEKEWRFVVAEGVVVAGSQYKQGSELVAQTGTDRGAAALAATIVAHGYAPDPVWILDVCQTTDGEYHLLEIGCFSCASLYRCDPEAVVRAVSQAAQRMHAAA